MNTMTASNAVISGLNALSMKFVARIGMGFVLVRSSVAGRAVLCRGGFR
jgi:hypothetical protein